jgi:hypothetical protein
VYPPGSNAVHSQKKTLNWDYTALGPLIWDYTALAPPSAVECSASTEDILLHCITRQVTASRARLDGELRVHRWKLTGITSGLTMKLSLIDIHSRPN